MRFACFLLLLLVAFLPAAPGCKARKETQKESKNGLADTYIQTSGKTAFKPDTLVNLFTDADNGKKATFKKGETFNLLLESNMTTGYAWVISGIDSAIVKQVAGNYLPNSNPQQAVGVGGKQWYAFKTLAPGMMQLKLAYKRPWETKEPPALTFELGVEVADK
ncbi:hypothetical protein C7N43_12940 [Sphingobacteriales bacterium UPWRP_1]|nr:hypothetical protein BVG80_14440 [Sphingobacteriales bacterium TSM_CSM]PSJ76598.1 hypothetical protein C7N43_12940 [Sphingobacteriales bacterium UPWRP_1]